MNTEELTKWHHTEWWPTYCQFLETPVKNEWGPGGKGKSLAKILRLKPSEELRKRMLANLIEQMIHRSKLAKRMGLAQYLKYSADRAKKGEEVYKNRQSLTYLNQMGWEDEIPAMQATDSRPETKKCFCGKETHGPKFDYCTEHLSANIVAIK